MNDMFKEGLKGKKKKQTYFILNKRRKSFTGYIAYQQKSCFKKYSCMALTFSVPIAISSQQNS